MLAAIVGIGQILSLVAVAYGALLVAVNRPGVRQGFWKFVRNVAETGELFRKSLELAHAAERNKMQAVRLGRATFAGSARYIAEPQAAADGARNARAEAATAGAAS